MTKQTKSFKNEANIFCNIFVYIAICYCFYKFENDMCLKLPPWPLSSGPWETVIKHYTQPL